MSANSISYFVFQLDTPERPAPQPKPEWPPTQPNPMPPTTDPFPTVPPVKGTDFKFYSFMLN